MVTAQKKIDKAGMIGELLYIDNKDGVVVPFRFNRAQRYFHSNKGHRNIILKARQLGMSSSILADMLTDCIIFPNTQCVVVSHEGRATQRLLDRVQFYYDTMSPPKPELDASSRSEKSFKDLHSSIYVGVAGARAFGHGDTIRKAHISELAWYEDDTTVINGVEDAVPMSGELTIESTPNGEDNSFYEKWIKAREGKSPYKPFFFPWWWDDEYRIPKGSELVIPVDREELTCTKEELDLIELHKLDEDQIRWRRWKIGEKGAFFWQEYPEDEVSCFITIGDPVFDPYMLNEFASRCTEGRHHEWGWTYWLEPEENLRYIIGVDTSSGAPEGSYSAAVVLNDRWEVCATYQGRVEPHILAGILKQLGLWYNTAELVIERNFTGYAVLEQLQDYPNIAHQRDFTTGKITSQKGWWSNDQTRDLLMSVTKENLGSCRLWDVNLVRQLRSYRYIKLKTKYREQAQTYDDLAIAFMLAVTSRKVAGTARGYQGAVWSGMNW